MMIFGRTKEKNILTERTKAFASGFRQNIAIIGRPFIGKTLLVQNILPFISSQNIVIVYVECRQEPFYIFCRRFMGSLLYQYLKLKSDSVKNDDLPALVRDCRKQLPKVTEAIDKIEEYLKKKDFDAAYDLTLELPRILRPEADIKCAVVIEEFDRLIAYKLSCPFSALGKKIMAQRDTFYIITSSSVKQAWHILAEKLHLLFGNFELLELDGFDFAESEGFILSRLDGFGAPEQYVRFLINFTDGNPYYLDIITARIKQVLSAAGKNRLAASALEQALEEVLFNSSGELYQHFNSIVNTHCVNKNGVDILSLLTLVSDGKCKVKGLSAALNSPASSIAAALSDLEAAGLVEKMGALIKIDDPVFRFWLTSVCQKNRTDFTIDPDYRRRIFIGSLKKSSNEFLRSSKEDLYEKAVGLFKSFDNDIIEIGQKRFVLPNFSDVATRVIGENGPYIVCHSKGTNWICQIRERKVGEKHITDFLTDTKSGRYRFQRKVLIVTDEMDENAKLLAKNKGVWAWNLKTLNMLLDLYGKYKVIKL